MNWTNVPKQAAIMGITKEYTEMYKAFQEAKKIIWARSEYFSITDSIITDCLLFAELIKSHVPTAKIEEWGNNGKYRITSKT